LKASSIATLETEQGAAADNACREWSAGRRKAPRKSLAPRDPSTALKRVP